MLRCPQEESCFLGDCVGGDYPELYGPYEPEAVSEEEMLVTIIVILILALGAIVGTVCKWIVGKGGGGGGGGGGRRGKPRRGSRQFQQLDVEDSSSVLP